MLRRPLPTAIAFAFGLLLLGWGLVSLQRIFIEERDQALVALALREETLAQYASATVERQLGKRLSDTQERLTLAREDPLIPDHDIIWVVDGAQVLPRNIVYASDPTDAAALTLQLQQQPSKVQTAPGPWADRVKLVTALHRGIAAKDAPLITQAVRALLNHRAKYILPPLQEIPSALATAELFIRGTTPDRSLVQALLRDGLDGLRGSRIEGLQRMLLERRSRFSQEDFHALAAQLASLSEDARVPHGDFDNEARRTSSTPLSLPLPLHEPALLQQARWYAEPYGERGLQAVSVELTDLVADIEQEMREGGLLDEGERIAAPAATDEPMRLRDMHFRVVSQSQALAKGEVHGRYRLKTGLGVALAGLAAGILLLVTLLVRRKQRFLQARADFVSTVSHELRTPLASMRLMAETLDRRLGGVEQARDFPARIVAEADRLAFLVDNILVFNRLERGNTAFRREAISLAELVEQLQIEAEGFAKKPVRIAMSENGAPGEEDTIDADPELIRLLFSNLLSNACKYNARESIELRLSYRVDGRETFITFTDNGIGIPTAVQAKIFAPFVRAKDAGESGRGVGLGLAICMRVMELHQGSIRLAHSGPEGSTFELRFPAGR